MNKRDQNVLKLFAAAAAATREKIPDIFPQ